MARRTSGEAGGNARKGAALPRRLAKGTPKGRQLRDILEGLVTTLPPGSALPSERELAERYEVARMTVRSELDRLTTEGLTYRLQGRGTFVAEPRVAQATAFSSFSEDMRARGMVPSSRVLSQSVVIADEFLARRLELAPDAPLVRIHRVRRADGTPMAVEEAHLPGARFPGLEEADFSKVSLFEELGTRWSVRLRDADQRVVAVAIEGEEAGLLGVADGVPGLRFQTLARDPEGAPVFYGVSLFRGDRYEVDLRQVRLDDR